MILILHQNPWRYKEDWIPMYLALLEILLKGSKNKILFLNDFVSLFWNLNFKTEKKVDPCRKEPMCLMQFANTSKWDQIIILWEVLNWFHKYHDQKIGWHDNITNKYFFNLCVVKVSVPSLPKVQKIMLASKDILKTMQNSSKIRTILLKTCNLAEYGNLFKNVYKVFDKRQQ